MASSPKDEVQKRDADGAHRKRGRGNQKQAGESPAVALMSRAPGTLGQQEKAERAAHQKKVHRNKIERAGEGE